jgi:hypothetical protein
MEKCLLHLTKKCHEPTARNSAVFTGDYRNVIIRAKSMQRCFRTVPNNKTTLKTSVKRVQGSWVPFKLNR